MTVRKTELLKSATAFLLALFLLLPQTVIVEAATTEHNSDSGYDLILDDGADFLADEDEDPKHFIQQLTGKLSQSLNSYEDKDDEGLYKYVGKMINRQVAKNLDDKGKKEMIRAIKSVETDSDDDLDNDLESDEYDDEQMNQEEMSESRNGFSKRQLKKLCEEFGVVDNSKPLRDNVKATKLRKSPFSPKIFKK